MNVVIVPKKILKKGGSGGLMVKKTGPGPEGFRFESVSCQVHEQGTVPTPLVLPPADFSDS